LLESKRCKIATLSFSERSAKLEDIVTALIDANYLLREETPLNFGPLLFFPVHMAFGGRIRYLISNHRQSRWYEEGP
jgi:hypothetical protein